MAKKKPPGDADDASTSLGDLLRASGYQPTTEPDPPPDSALSEAEPDAMRLSGRCVLRRTRKGRGGKAVTLVEGMDLTASALEHLAREIRKTLGCGATVEDKTIVVQGDQVDRLQPWLVERGVKKVVIGS